MDQPTATDWIEHEDHAARADRIGRLEWLAASYPSSDGGFLLSGGWLSHQLLEEAKYCFAYGQFLATAILGVAFIERVLAARFYASGRDDLERAGGLDLLREAVKHAMISPEEFKEFDKVRRLRNPIVHFRRPLAPDTHEFRAVKTDVHPITPLFFLLDCLEAAPVPPTLMSFAKPLTRPAGRPRSPNGNARGHLPPSGGHDEERSYGHPDEIAQGDAQEILKSVFSVLGRSAV